MNKYIPLSIPNFEGNERKYVDDAVEQGWVSTGGKYIELLEEKLTEYVGAADVAACQSGTSAIHLSLIDAGIGTDDMVIVPTLTFIAAVNPVKYVNAIPIFMDCDNSLCIDPIKVRRFCEEECYVDNNTLFHRNTKKIIKAIIVVHVFGNMADMESLMEIAKEYNLVVIEDATEALGTKYISGKYAGKYAGTIGDYGAYSFNGNKIITTGGGGAVTAKKRDKVKHMRYLSTQAKDDATNYIHNEIGYNYRMTNVQAAIGLAQMEELPEFIRRKQANYEMYKELMKDVEDKVLLGFREDIDSNKWFYSVKFEDKNTDEIIEKLKKYGIQTRKIWGLIHEQKPYKNEIAYMIENAVYYRDRIVNVPCSTSITIDEIEKVVNSILSS